LLLVFNYCQNPLLFRLQQTETTPSPATVGGTAPTFPKHFRRAFASLFHIIVGIKKSRVVKVQQISFHHHLMCLVSKQWQLILFALANTNYPVIILAFQPCLH